VSAGMGLLLDNPRQGVGPVPIEVAARPVIAPRRSRVRVPSRVLASSYSPTALAAFSRNSEPSRM
jgi:hypothetical protein